MEVYLKDYNLPTFDKISYLNLENHKTLERPNRKLCFPVLSACRLDTLYYNGYKLRLLITETGLEWFVDDLLFCFFGNGERPKNILSRLRELPPTLKYKRDINFGDDIKRRHTTIAHDVVWDVMAQALTSDQLFQFIEWYKLHTKYIHLETARSSKQDVIDYFRQSRPISSGVGRLGAAA